MNYDYILFIVPDIGVVNPRRRIEKFIDAESDIVMYERFHPIELMVDSYLVKNSRWARDFLERKRHMKIGWADYEKRLPHSFHGDDNGALYVRITYYRICIT
ncbi:unnamed protein product [Strongylus vulgaris]|uniref:Glycosyltransferase family 92 protein n=1 Tax=Strongylus vulgaris TaxID=40348 RepID=A0A3P7IP01_STRVU|nr:unnamed protein product [Strongylus vulgaris]